MISYFEMDLVKAIQHKKLNDFDEITPIYKKEYPDAILSTATGDASPQKGAVVNQRTAKAAAAAKAKVAATATAAARNDNNRRHYRNERYGLRNQPNTYSNIQCRNLNTHRQTKTDKPGNSIQ